MEDSLSDLRDDEKSETKQTPGFMVSPTPGGPDENGPPPAPPPPIDMETLRRRSSYSVDVPTVPSRSPKSETPKSNGSKISEKLKKKGEGQKKQQANPGRSPKELREYVRKLSAQRPVPPPPPPPAS